MSLKIVGSFGTQVIILGSGKQLQDKVILILNNAWIMIKRRIRI